MSNFFFASQIHDVISAPQIQVRSAALLRVALTAPFTSCKSDAFTCPKRLSYSAILSGTTALEMEIILDAHQHIHHEHSIAQKPTVGQGILIIEASRSHSHTTLGRTPLYE